MGLKDFEERLANARKEKGYTQEELAKRLGVTPQAISKWERGLVKRRKPIRNLIKIIEALEEEAALNDDKQELLGIITDSLYSPSD